VHISLYPLLTVQPPDLILTSLVSHTTLCSALHARRTAARHLSALGMEQWDPIFPFQPLMGLKL